MQDRPALRACLNSLTRERLVLPAGPVAMMMPMITPVAVVMPMIAPVAVVMVVAPVHLGGDVLGVILHRGGGAGTGQ